MKRKTPRLFIPTLKFSSDYFRCPRCGWETPSPRLVKGDIAQTACEKCGHSYLVRIKQFYVSLEEVSCYFTECISENF